jgi:hypothetical protein
MSKTVIKVSNLSNRYRIGLKEKQAETLAGQIANLIKPSLLTFMTSLKLVVFEFIKFSQNGLILGRIQQR